MGIFLHWKIAETVYFFSRHSPEFHLAAAGLKRKESIAESQEMSKFTFSVSHAQSLCFNILPLIFLRIYVASRFKSSIENGVKLEDLLSTEYLGSTKKNPQVCARLWTLSWLCGFLAPFHAQQPQRPLCICQLASHGLLNLLKNITFVPWPRGPVTWRPLPLDFNGYCTPYHPPPASAHTLLLLFIRYLRHPPTSWPLQIVLLCWMY